jgi:hypothetical protein
MFSLFGGRPRGSKNRTRSFRRRSASKRRSTRRTKVSKRMSRRRSALKRLFEGLRKFSRKGKRTIGHRGKSYALFNSPNGEYIYKGPATKGSRRVKHRLPLSFGSFGSGRADSLFGMEGPYPSMS